MSSDALERLKNRRRPTVPPRDASLTPAPVQQPAPPDTATPPPPPEPTLQTKQSTLRLEQGMSDRLQDLVRQHGLCREVVIEAMFAYCEAHPRAMQAVLAESQTKQAYRQQIANQKRAKSMMQRFGPGATP